MYIKFELANNTTKVLTTADDNFIIADEVCTEKQGLHLRNKSYFQSPASALQFLVNGQLQKSDATSLEELQTDLRDIKEKLLLTYSLATE